jgi:two-component sensor histidine kinase
MPLPTFYPAILLAALVGGARAGIFATILAGVTAWWAFMAPHYAFSPLTSGQLISLAIYSVASLLIVWMADHYRALTRQLEDEEKLRKLAVEELAHRLKNKIATIQSILSFQLREQPRLKDDIIGRLSALAATDDLIMKAQGYGANLHDILATELGPYEKSRTVVDGPSILLPAKLALTMAMLFHELATNAAKYGALSGPHGRVSVCWSSPQGQLKLEWRESGGPSVGFPTQQGFGIRLLSRALDQFHGTYDARFAPTGFECTMSVPLGEDTSAPTLARKPEPLPAAASL